MAGINKVILVGNLGKDPEIRTFENGGKVAQFSLATSEAYKDKEGNWQEQTEWHNIVVWRHLAERAENFLKKGSKIYLEGKIRSRSWEDKDNNKRYITEIVGDKVLLLDKREGGGNYQAPPPPMEESASSASNTSNNTTAEPAIENSADDDLPF
jgi:single-strand DNA-binding protein